MKSGNHGRPSRILFASCNSQHYDAVLWPAMTSRNAAALVWGGDAIYADDFYPPTSLLARPTNKEATPEDLRTLYERLLRDPGYETLTKRRLDDDDNSAAAATNGAQQHVDTIHDAPDSGGSSSSRPLEERRSSNSNATTTAAAGTQFFTVLGVFDDHDYGINNGDVLYQHKKESAILFLNFLKKSSSNDVNLSLMEQRAQNGKGVYGVKVFDFAATEAGHELLSDQEAGIEPLVDSGSDSSTTVLSDRSVAIFLLDCRSNKTPWKKEYPDRFLPDYAADFLGEEQWQWFEAALRRSAASVNVIVNGLQVHSDKYFDGNHAEDWSRFPMAQHRFYQALLQSGASAPVIVSGDVHMAEILRKDCSRGGDDDDDDDENEDDAPATRNKRSLLEVTTSGMTHSWCSNICARPKSIACRTQWLHRALCVGMHWAHRNGAWTDVVDLVGPPREEGAKRRVQYALERNFAEFEFLWDTRELVVRIFGESGDGPILSTAWDFDMVSGLTPLEATKKLHQSDYEQELRRLSAHGARRNEWICLNYRGHPSLALKLFGVLSPISLAAFITFLPIFVPLTVLYLLKRRFLPRWKQKKA
jgi:PhoD-like phosphatase